MGVVGRCEGGGGRGGGGRKGWRRDGGGGGVGLSQATKAGPSLYASIIMVGGAQNHLN